MRFLARLLMVLSVVLQGMMPAVAMQVATPVQHQQSMQAHTQDHGAQNREAASAKTSGHCPTCAPMHAMACCSASLCGTCLTPMPEVVQGQEKILPLSYPKPARAAALVAGVPDPLVPPPRA
jgi:hypothetical protein